MDISLKKLNLGTIGFGYPDWEGGFYPPGLPTRDYLKYYSRVFNAVEIDTTFYGTPKAETVTRWASDVKEDFTFCVKTPRSITHQMGLIGTRGLMDEFITSIRLFGHKLGAILIQLPPRFTADRFKVLRAFLQDIPNDLSFAIEFRNLSWYSEETQQLLTEFNICWAITEYPGLPMDIRRTTDFLYLRWIGQHGSYDSHTYERIDKKPQLEIWWDQIKPFLNNITSLYGFFNNDYSGFAAGTCKSFKSIIGIPPKDEQLPDQKRLF